MILETCILCLGEVDINQVHRGLCGKCHQRAFPVRFSNAQPARDAAYGNMFPMDWWLTDIKAAELLFVTYGEAIYSLKPLSSTRSILKLPNGMTALGSMESVITPYYVKDSWTNLYSPAVYSIYGAMNFQEPNIPVFIHLPDYILTDHSIRHEIMGFLVSINDMLFEDTEDDDGSWEKANVYTPKDFEEAVPF